MLPGLGNYALYTLWPLPSLRYSQLDDPTQLLPEGNWAEEHRKSEGCAITKKFDPGVVHIS